jgi:hypothetical protein
VKVISNLALACLLGLSLSGCGNEDVKPDPNAPAIGCANHLRGIDKVNDTPTEADLEPYFRHGMLKCPEGGTYTIGKVGDLPQCSIAAHNDYFKEHLTP